MHYHFRIHREKTGCWAECLELQGCQTEGSNQDELKHNMGEALNLFLDEPMNSKQIFPFPKKRLTGKNIVKVSVDPRVAFAFYLRMIRLKNHMTQKKVAERLKKALWSYQKLESSKLLIRN